MITITLFLAVIFPVISAYGVFVVFSIFIHIVGIPIRLLWRTISLLE